jgi:hypothetical protein
MLDLEWGRRRKESMSLIAGAEAEGLIVANACNEILADIAEGIEQLLAQSRPAFALRQGLSIVMAGGPTQLPGFEERAGESLTGRLSGKFPPRIRVAAGGESALARGCLIHAALESESRVAATRISA